MARYPIPLLTLEAAKGDPTLWDRCNCGGRAALLPTSDGGACANCDECPESTEWYRTPWEVVIAWNKLQRGIV